MWVVIPLCGLGERFTAAGFRTPKPFLRHGGKTLIEHVLASFSRDAEDEVILIAPANYRNRGLEQLMAPARVDVVYLHRPTGGALETVYRGLMWWYQHQRGGRVAPAPIVVMDSDTYYTVDVMKIVRDIAQCDAGIVVFHDVTERVCYSFAEVAPNGHVTRIVEKERISDWALSGIYVFRAPITFFERAGVLLRWHNDMVGRECYMSGLVAAYVNEGAVLPMYVHADDVRCLGTPEQWMVAKPPPTQPMRVCFDLDNTLVTAPTVPGDYATVGPIVANIAFLRQLKASGHTIIIHTARRMRTHSGNVGKVIADVAPVTLQTLAAYDIPYDELYFGKPHADVYIDDLAVNALDANMYKEVCAFNEDAVLPRAFNRIDMDDDNVTKSSSLRADKIRAEVAWYRSVPDIAAPWFPTLVDVTLPTASAPASYTMTRIRSPTFSHLFVNELLTTHMFTTMLNQLVAIHASEHHDNGALIYNNYMPKWRARPRHARVTDHQAQDIEAFLEEYAREGRAIPARVHGDPVFTNIFWDEGVGHAKFIDVGGVQNDVATVAGDAMYDYAKVLQSLSGYDEVLAGRAVSFAYKRPLIDVFWRFIDRVVGIDRRSDVECIKDFLLLSLLPLHDPEMAHTLYELYA
jgi:capsule biosynthesis phosphatase